MRIVDAHIISTCCSGGKDKIDDFSSTADDRHNRQGRRRDGGALLSGSVPILPLPVSYMNNLHNLPASLGCSRAPGSYSQASWVYWAAAFDEFRTQKAERILPKIISRRNSFSQAAWQKSFTFKPVAFCWACHRSNCIWWFSQLSGLPPKAFDKRMAITGVTQECPFKRLDSVFLVIPSPAAASVTVSPKGSRHISRISSPGCGGSCINIVTLVNGNQDNRHARRHSLQT